MRLTRRRLSVLVVDDEREIRTLLTDILEGAGHEVACAPDAATAASLVADPGRHFDLAFVDYLLPGEDGIALISRLRSLRPELPAVLLTGDTGLTGAGVSAAGGPIGLITKPFGLFIVEDLLARMSN